MFTERETEAPRGEGTCMGSLRGANKSTVPGQRMALLLACCVVLRKSQALSGLLL